MKGFGFILVLICLIFQAVWSHFYIIQNQIFVRNNISSPFRKLSLFYQSLRKLLQ